MNQRQLNILSAVVEEYTKTGLPVGSAVLAKEYLADVSPATVRNDMATLEEDGLLYQPHVSAGRVPTDKGYRFFVESMMEDKELSHDEQKELQKEVLQLRAKNTRMTRSLAKLLSVTSGAMALSSLPGKEEFHEFGLQKIIQECEENDLDEICRLTEVFDYIDERMDVLLKGMQDGETKIFIGKENPIAEMQNYSMVVSPFRNEEGERGMIALIGPKRMAYARNKSLIEFIKKMISGSAVFFIFMQI